VTFTAPHGTAFHYQGDGSGDAHIVPAIGEPSVEVPIDDLVAFVAHVVIHRRSESVERDAKKRGRN